VIRRGTMSGNDLHVWWRTSGVPNVAPGARAAGSRVSNRRSENRGSRSLTISPRGTVGAAGILLTLRRLKTDRSWRLLAPSGRAEPGSVSEQKTSWSMWSGGRRSAECTLSSGSGSRRSTAAPVATGKTIRRTLRSAEPSRYRRPPRPSKFDPFRGEIDRLLPSAPRLPGARGFAS